MKRPAFVPREVWPYLEESLVARAEKAGWESPSEYVEIERKVLDGPDDLSSAVLWNALCRAALEAKEAARPVMAAAEVAPAQTDAHMSPGYFKAEDRSRLRHRRGVADSFESVDGDRRTNR